MFNRSLIIIVFLLSFSLQASVKEELASVYAAAFNNQWKQVSAKAERLVSDYETSKDVERSLEQLDELESFVLDHDLNPEKVDAFFLALYSARVNIRKELDKKVTATNTPAKKQSKLKEVIVAPATPVPDVVAGLDSWIKWGTGLTGFFLAVFALFYFWLKRKETIVETTFPFESSLSKNGLEHWKHIKPKVQKCTELTQEAVVYDYDELFSLEFKLNSKASVSSFSDIKKTVEEMNGELLIVSNWQSGTTPTRHLVFNFPNSDQSN